MLAFLCYLFAFVCFALAGFTVNPPRVNLIGLGLAAFVLPTLIGAWPS
jgi:hypothetical protein